MKVLTPTGYKDPVALANGDDVCAFDLVTGAPIINKVENIDFVDYVEWCRWWSVEDTVPAFNWYRINGKFVLFGEQSIWRNGVNVCHAKHLVVGDVIHDDADQDITITSVEEFADDSLVWYRFDISGDHSYIVDGLTVHNASRFWVSGTGTWDSSTTTHWGSSSGTANNSSVPGSADTVTLDGSSGGGTVTLGFGGTITIQSLTKGAHTGTFDNSVNNNNITLSASGNAWNATGSGTRTDKLGTATYTLTNNIATWNYTIVTNLTYTGTTANVVFSGASGLRQFIYGNSNVTYGSLTFGASSGAGYCLTSGAGILTVGTLTITAPNYVTFGVVSHVVTNAINWAGSSTAQIGLASSTVATATAITAASGSVASWCSFHDMGFVSNTVIATSSLDVGNNSGVTITPPGAGPKFSGAFVG